MLSNGLVQVGYLPQGDIEELLEKQIDEAGDDCGPVGRQDVELVLAPFVRDWQLGFNGRHFEQKLIPGDEELIAIHITTCINSLAHLVMVIW